jgi:hypothetical protein
VAEAVRIQGRIPLVRCYDGSHHFFSTDVTCGGGSSKMEQALGCMMGQRDSNTPRALRACREASGRAYHMLDAPCVGGDVDGGVLGYVH